MLALSLARFHGAPRCPNHHPAHIQNHRQLRIECKVSIDTYCLETLRCSMKNLIHPGMLIRRYCLDPHNLNVTDAAYVLGVSRQALSNLLSGRAGISPEMAIRLDLVFGGGAEAWLRRQTEHDLAEARQRSSDLVVHALNDKAPRHKQPELF